MAVGLRLNCPVSITADVQGPITGSADAGCIVLAPGLQKQHSQIRIYCKALRRYGTGGSRSAEIVLGLWARGEIPPIAGSGDDAFLTMNCS